VFITAMSIVELVEPGHYRVMNMGISAANTVFFALVSEDGQVTDKAHKLWKSESHLTQKFWTVSHGQIGQRY
jgi:hypothetical protein